MEFWQVYPVFHSIFRHEKKVLALVLAFACAFTMFAGAAFTDQADINADNVDAVDLLTTLKIIKGYEDGSFDPDGVVTRAEMAKMIYTIRNDGNDDASAHVGNTTSFTDISGHWAEGYIKYLQNTGIVAGKSATKFDPDSQVTTVEAMKMALALTGYDEKNAGLTGIDWEKNTLSYATTIGLTDDVASAMRSGCARQDAAQILANCLGATAVRYSAVVENFVNDSKEGLSFGGDPISVGYKWMDLCTNIGTLVGIDGDKLTITMTQSDAADSDIPSIKQFIDLDTDYSDLLGQKVKVLFNDGKNNEVIGVYATVDNTVYTVEANDTSKDDDKVSFGGESYRLDDEGRIRTYIDGSSTPIWTSLDELDHNALNPNMYTFVDTDDNGRLDTLVVRTYEVAKASYVASDRIIAHGYTYETDDNTVADDIAQDDWVVITKDLYNDNYSIVKADVQTAALDAMRDNRNKDIHFDNQALVADVDYFEYQVGDNWYNGSSDEDAAKVVQSNRSENDLHAVRAGEDVDYVAVNGIMFYVQRASGDFNGKVDNVAMILKKDDTDISDRARIQLFNGDTEAVEVGHRSGDVTFDDLQEGVLYEYSVSGGKYYFEELKDGVADDRYEEYYGDLTYRGDKVEGDDYEAADVVADQAKFDDVTIDDKAEVMLFSYQTSGNVPVEAATMTGKQFKALDLTDILGDFKNVTLADSTAHDFDDGVVAYAFSGKLGGLNRIGALAIQVEDGASLDALTYDSWNNYGYILTDAKFVNNNNKTMTYTIWTGSEAIEVQEDYNDLDNREKGQLIGFNDLERGDVNVIDDVDVINANVTMDAVTDVGTDGDTVDFKIGGEKDISDATIMFVDSDNGEGFTADEVNGIKTATKDINGDYLANAIYYTDNNGDIALVIFDTVDWMHNDKYNGDLPDSGVIYGDDAVWDKDDQKDDDDTTVVGNFTFVSSEPDKVKVAKASVTPSNEVRFVVELGGIDMSKTSFDWKVTADGIAAVSGTKNVTGTADVNCTISGTTVTTSGADVSADQDITITISNIVVAADALTEDATAEQINAVLEDADSSEAVVLAEIPAGTINVPEGKKIDARNSNIDQDAVINIGKNAVINLTGANVAEGAQIKIDKDAVRVTLPNGTELTSSVFEADCTLTLKANADGGVTVIVPANGEVTLASNFTLSAVDKIQLGEDAVLAGTGTNTLTVTTAGSITGDINNFYNSAGTTELNTVGAGIYTWDDTNTMWKASV